MTQEEELARLRADNAALREQVAALTAALETAQQRIAELEVKKTPPPAFVKANVPKKAKQARKQRAAEHNHARRLEPPTQIIEHRLERCPACQGRHARSASGPPAAGSGPAAPTASAGY